ncbi:MAG: AMP-binding protein [Actinomycetota bacterium]
MIDPEGTAFVQDGYRLSFSEAQHLIERLAGHLHSLGVGPGDVVSWQLPNWWEAAIVHHAALRIGAVPNPLNQIFRENELSFVLTEAKPKVLVVPASHRGFDHAKAALALSNQIDSIEHVIVVRGSEPGAIELSDLLDRPAETPSFASQRSDLALLLYTSGTTSNPKGVMHSHETLQCEVQSLQAAHRITPEDRYLGGSPVTHIAGLVYGLLMPFVLGTSTVLLERWDPLAAIEAIERDGATFQTGAPTFLYTLASAAKHKLDSFRLFSTGGASIDTKMVQDAERKLGCTVKRAYGSTEVPTLTATSFDDPVEIRLGTDGRVIDSAQMRISSEGEIFAKAPEMFLGYRNPALNEGIFEDGWFKTGDLGTIDSEGNLRVTGRTSDIIIRGGENISASEVEALILTHPLVEEVAVVGIPDPVLGERACAFVVPREGATLTLFDIIEHLSAAHIAKQKLPEQLRILRALPRTSSGKVEKAKLRERAT